MIVWYAQYDTFQQIYLLVQVVSICFALFMLFRFSYFMRFGIAYRIASRNLRKSKDRPSGLRTRSWLDLSAGLESGRCGQPPLVLHIIPDFDKVFDINDKTSMSLYPDIAPIS